MSQHLISTDNSSHFEEATGCIEKDNVYFLPNKSPAPKKEELTKSIQSENTKGYLEDIQILSASQLSEKHKLTYSSWKNMKQRCKTMGNILDPRFVKFADFLMHMGPRPSKQFTLDRVDFKNPNYGPDHCRWADKHTQNQNKGNNVLICYKDETLPISVWAKRTGQKADTLYHRKSKGWIDEAVITGNPTKISVATIQVGYIKAIEELENHLVDTIRALHDINQELNYYYDLNGPESSPPTDVVAKHEAVQRNYWVLLNEIKRRLPHYDVHHRLRYAFKTT